jgi:hypothetical protein
MLKLSYVILLVMLSLLCMEMFFVSAICYAGFNHWTEVSWFCSSKSTKPACVLRKPESADVYNWGNVQFGVAVVPTPGVQKNHSSLSQRFVGKFSSQHWFTCMRLDRYQTNSVYSIFWILNCGRPPHPSAYFGSGLALAPLNHALGRRQRSQGLMARL